MGSLVFGPLTVASYHHVGDRPNQEDFSAVVKRKDGSVLAVLADGMGGFDHGFEAAQGAVNAFAGAFLASPMRHKASTPAVFEACFDAAHQAALRAGGGCALTAAWTHPDRPEVDLAWAGDVRAFRVSAVGVRANTDVDRPPYARNRLTRSLGVKGGGGAFTQTYWPFISERAVVLATDGAWDVPDLDVATVWKVAPPARARLLVDLALGLGAGRGDRDNASAVVISRELA